MDRYSTISPQRLKVTTASGIQIDLTGRGGGEGGLAFLGVCPIITAGPGGGAPNKRDCYCPN